MADGLLSSEPRAHLLRLWLQDAIERARNSERLARNAYRKPYMAEAATLMADLHGQCAYIYESKLRELEAANG